VADLLSGKSVFLWAIVLAVALFYPVRQLIWVLSVRRAERDGNEDEARRQALKRRATVTSVLLSFVFAVIYTTAIMRGDR